MSSSPKMFLTITLFHRILHTFPNHHITIRISFFRRVSCINTITLEWGLTILNLVAPYFPQSPFYSYSVGLHTVLSMISDTMFLGFSLSMSYIPKLLYCRLVLYDKLRTLNSVAENILLNLFSLSNLM